MSAESYAMAAAIAMPEGAEAEVLDILCSAEEQKLTAALGERAEACREALLCAAAHCAAAALLESRGEAISFTAGDVSIRQGESRSAALRRTASAVLRSCGLDGGFAFLGVRG